MPSDTATEPAASATLTEESTALAEPTPDELAAMAEELAAITAEVTANAQEPLAGAVAGSAGQPAVQEQVDEGGRDARPPEETEPSSAMAERSTVQEQVDEGGQDARSPEEAEASDAMAERSTAQDQVDEGGRDARPPEEAEAVVSEVSPVDAPATVESADTAVVPAIESAVSEIDEHLAALESLLADNPPVADEIVAAADSALSTLEQAAAEVAAPAKTGEHPDGPRSAPPDWIVEAAQEISRESASISASGGTPSISAEPEGDEQPPAAPNQPRPSLLRRLARVPFAVLEVIDLPFAGLGPSVKAVIGAVAVGTLLLAIGLLVAGDRVLGAIASKSAPPTQEIHDAPAAAAYNGGHETH